VDGFPAPRSPYLPRRFRAMRTLIERFAMDGLRPGLDWLIAHQPDPCRTSILHLDYHPLNVIRRPDGTLVVLDWTYADCGDVHLDVGMTLMMLEAVPIAGHSWWDRLATRVGRSVEAQGYLQRYRRHQPLDAARLDYYRAWSTLHQLVRYGRWLRADPAASDCKPSVVVHLGPHVLEALYRYFRRWTGIDVRL